MDEKKPFLHYIGETMTTFGVSMVAMGTITLLFGDSARGLSSLFTLGSAGIPLHVAGEFLLMNAVITVLRFIFYTDALFSNLAIWIRFLCMLSSIIAMVAIFNLLFGWFPPDDALAWTMFFVTFGAFFCGGCIITALRERQANRRMNQALGKIKKGDRK